MAEFKSCKRIEIIYSQAVEEDVFEALRKEGYAKHFTKLSNVFGSGFSNPKLGDAIWPQVNEMLIMYCDEQAVAGIAGVVAKLRERYPVEGIACFVSDAQII